jgi:hypothetical protein
MCALREIGFDGHRETAKEVETMPVIGVLLILLGVLAAIMPFLGQAVGLGPDAQVFMTEGQIFRHGIPGAAIVLGGLLMLPRIRGLRMFGGILAVAGGAWLLTVPTLLGWLTGDLTRTETAWALGAYYATGFAVTFFAGLAIGYASGAWAAERRVVRRVETEEEIRAEEEARVDDPEVSYDEPRRRRRADDSDVEPFDREDATA